MSRHFSRPILSFAVAVGFAASTFVSPASVGTALALPALAIAKPAGAALEADSVQYRRHHAPRRHVRGGGGNHGAAAAAAVVGVLALGALAAAASQSNGYDDDGYYAPAPVYSGNGYGYGYGATDYGYQPAPVYRRVYRQHPPRYVAQPRPPRHYVGPGDIYHAPRPYRGHVTTPVYNAPRGYPNVVHAPQRGYAPYHGRGVYAPGARPGRETLPTFGGAPSHQGGK